MVSGRRGRWRHGVVQDGRIIQEAKFSTSSQAPKDQIIAELIQGLEAFVDAEVVGIGINVPGLVDETEGIIYDLQNIPSWQEVHLKAALEGVFKVPVFLSNDGNSFVLGEKVYGQGKAYKNLLGITRFFDHRRLRYQSQVCTVDGGGN